MPQNCCVPGCKKKVCEEDGVKISFHKFPKDRELFRKWIVALRRDVGKEFRVTDHNRGEGVGNKYRERGKCKHQFHVGTRDSWCYKRRDRQKIRCVGSRR